VQNLAGELSMCLDKARRTDGSFLEAGEREVFA